MPDKQRRVENRAAWNIAVDAYGFFRALAILAHFLGNTHVAKPTSSGVYCTTCGRWWVRRR